MIETRGLKNVAIFIQTILSFVLSRKIILIYIYQSGGAKYRLVKKFVVSNIKTFTE